MKYTETFRIRWHDTDAYRCVCPSSILVYMQETANHQLENAGMPLDKIRDEQRLGFVLSKIKILFHNTLHAYDNVEARTWTCESRGFTFSRCFDIHRDGELIAEAISYWALLNIDDGKLVRCDNFQLGIEPEQPLDISVPRRIKQPKAELVLLGERKISYSDIDYNNHMNNTRYPNMVCDFMPIDKVGRISEMTLEFLHESALGEILNVYGCEMDGVYYFKTINSAGDTCLVAEVMTL